MATHRAVPKHGSSRGAERSVDTLLIKGVIVKIQPHLGKGNEQNQQTQ